ncbi:MAG TPA: non-homologous end-joining DNA ligase [Dyadobacter sp.]|jgi:bifunctional non-homologous end joining protein LigD|nr:non-homologous end-joining DNA ligase [Dyadobacter sp.]
MENLKDIPDQKFSLEITPMLATLVDSPFDDEGWEYEIKWDGYRSLAFMNDGELSLRSRNKKSFNEKFFPVADALANWNIHAIIDGEVVAVDEEGISRFGLLQNWQTDQDGQLLFYVFDILWLNGKDLTGLPLTNRKKILAELMPADDSIIKSGYSVAAEGKAFFDAARQMGLEGIIAKRSDSVYSPGTRSKDWLKIKVEKRQEVVIAGYTKKAGSPKAFSSLLLGVYKKDTLQYIGKVGTGFSNQQQKELLATFKPLIRKKSPFDAIPEYNKPNRFRYTIADMEVTWLKPVLVCEVRYAEITQDGLFRHPSFIGMRTDKNAEEVVLEKPKVSSGDKKQGRSLR